MKREKKGPELTGIQKQDKNRSERFSRRNGKRQVEKINVK